MLLSDREIHAAIECGELVIVGTDPKHSFDRTKQVQPSSIDLRIGNRFLQFGANIKSLDIKRIDEIAKEITPVYYQEGEAITINPGETLFGEIYEQLRIPAKAAGIVVGRSRYARLGLSIHCTGGYINPEFEGAMPLQLANYNTIPIIIYPFIAICQLCLVRLSSPPLIPYPRRTDNPFHKEMHVSVSPGVFDQYLEGNQPRKTLQEIVEERLVSRYLSKLKEAGSSRGKGGGAKESVSVVIRGDNYAPLNTGIAGDIDSKVYGSMGLREQELINELLDVQGRIATAPGAKSGQVEEIRGLIEELIRQAGEKKDKRPSRSVLKVVLNKIMEIGVTVVGDVELFKKLYEKARVVFGF